MINVELKGGTVKEFESGVTPAEIAKSIGMGLYKSVCCARVDGNVVDLRTPITKDCRVDLLTFDEPDGKKAFWHTASHILAQAVKRLYPSAKCAKTFSLAYTCTGCKKTLSGYKTCYRSGY